MLYNTLKDGLKVVHWNAQGITNSVLILELEHFLNQNQIDIFLINDTFFSLHHKFKIRNYKIHKKDRITHGGGVLIGIKNSIPHERSKNFPTLVIENVSIIVKINNRSIRFTSVYCPQYTRNFNDDLDKIAEPNNQF